MKTHTLFLYRKKNALTQQQLASAIGISTNVITRIERNIGNYSVRRLLVWCRAENIDPQAIFPPDAAA